MEPTSGDPVTTQTGKHDVLLNDVKKLVNPGLRHAYQKHELLVIQHLSTVTQRCHGTSAHAVTEAIRSTVRDALGELGAKSAEALTELLALESNPGPVEKRQKAAAEAIGIKSAQGFKAHKQPGLLNELVDSLLYLEERGAELAMHRQPTVIEWPALQTAIVRLHARIDREFAPELMITMSGPGSFAACYFLSLNSRDLPLVVCTTFPARDTKLPAHQTFSDAAGAAGWIRLTPSKWNVYVPDVVRHLPRGYRVLILDDRVMSGESQQLLKQELKRDFGFDVRCAAVLTHSMSVSKLDWHGITIDEDYVMPWGARRGRE